MKKLTAKEEEIMRVLWEHGDLFIQDMLRYYPDPKPHHNTLATQLGFLEDKGYVMRERFANAYRYHALVAEDAFADEAVDSLVERFFNSSYARMVSRFVKEEKMDIDELKRLIADVERSKL
ncbi:MAG: BlaI/MecI/CopY family transcriptional regulator [Bacteroidales bacterium]|nr:BlaI/MecI/CopY family transcriptional regulator [Bacteroidales bacterium]